jgi:hypothetical protein
VSLVGARTRRRRGSPRTAPAGAMFV